jgi:nicotinate-nucleotide--dimethylbenzimidazole phosphoribosyltransferase
MPSVSAPSDVAHARATKRLTALATPPGALGRLGDLAVWVATCQGQVPPAPMDDVRLVIFAGDHGVAAHGVSAFPPAITGAMVRTFLAGKAGVSALAATHGVAVRVLDLGVDDDFTDLDEETRATVTAHKIRRGSGAIHLGDALTIEETHAALDAGAQVARKEIETGAQLLISGDMGIGNTTPAAALVAAGLGLPATEVVGRGTGIGESTLAHKTAVIDAALARVGARTADPVESLTSLGSADLAASTGFLLAAAQDGVPVLLDGLMSVACALTADRIEPGAASWYAAGHRSTEPAQALALAKMGLQPLLDLGLRLGEGSGAVAAVPIVRSSAALLRDVALLSDLG